MSRNKRTSRRWLTAAVSLVLIATGVVGVGWFRNRTPSYRAASAPSSTSSTTSSTTTPPTSTTAPKPRLPATWLGTSGVESRRVVDENARHGTTAWEIAPGAGTAISGFANPGDAHTGQRVTLYVSTPAPRFRVEAYRMGYYAGAGARLVWRSGTMASKPQPACPATPQTHMVSCDKWSPSLRIDITRAFVPGDYLLKLVGAGNQQSYVPLIVWDPSSHAAYLVKNDVYTWQAWNPYGGYDFYAGIGPCPPGVYPLCSRARVVSFDRPYAYGSGAGDFLGNEYPLVRFAEKHGLDVTYATDLTVEQHPNVLLAHRALLSLGHDECWSLHERLAAVAAEAHGVNIAFFAASPMLRHVRMQASPLGPGRQEVGYRDSGADPLDGHGDPREVTGNTWSSPPASWPEDSFVGATYSGYLTPGSTADFVAADGSAWIFKNSGLTTGAVLPGLLRSDFDRLAIGPHPANEQIFAHSPIPASATHRAAAGRVHSDMTYYTDPASGAGVFDSGTNDWIPALGSYEACTTCLIDPVGVVTGNLLAVLGRAPAGRVQPSVANWRTFYPGG
ncbi:MAG TPA: N,N-dimethylformamidase beta subunit family domain-containing protein [Acidimicrobiia bacterium]